MRRPLPLLQGALPLLGLLPLLSCGDALLEEGYRGVPVHRFSGQVTSVGGTASGLGPLRAAIFWNLDGTTDVDGRLVEQDALSVKVRFPGIFEINVFDGPPDLDWARPGDPWRVGLVLVYQDGNGDGRAQPEERQGGASHLVLLYAERALTAADAPLHRALAAGYHTLRVPMACEAPEDDEDADEVAMTCGVQLGAPCGATAPCGGEGVCVTSDRHHVWPDGYCMLRATSACVPAPALALPTDIGEGEALLYHQACDDPDDCRLDAGYTCGDEGACVPGEASALVIGPGFAVADLCAPEEAGESD